MKTVAPVFSLVPYLRETIKVIDVSVPSDGLDYTAAHALAERAAREAMLLAWYDSKVIWVIRKCKNAPATSPVGLLTLKATVATLQ